MATPPVQPPRPGGDDVRPLHPTIRITLVVTAGFLLVLGIDLTLAPSRTDEFFSWTIEPPLTAGTIGAFYVTGSFMIVMTLMGSAWARGRTVILGGVAFSILAIVATLLDLDRFAFDSDEPVAFVVAWVWILSYATVPVVLLLSLIPQSRVPGIDPRLGPPPRWVTVSLAVAGTVMVAAAAALSVVPEDMAELWPWTLTPLTARVLGAWMAGFALVFLWVVWEKDRFQALPAVATLGFLGLAQLLTVARFRDDVSWEEPGAWIYVAALGIALVAGGLGWALLRRAEGTPQVTDPAQPNSPRT